MIFTIFFDIYSNQTKPPISIWSCFTLTSTSTISNEWHLALLKIRICIMDSNPRKKMKNSMLEKTTAPVFQACLNSVRSPVEDQSTQQSSSITKAQTFASTGLEVSTTRRSNQPVAFATSMTSCWPSSSYWNTTSESCTSTLTCTTATESKRHSTPQTESWRSRFTGTEISFLGQETSKIWAREKERGTLSMCHFWTASMMWVSKRYTETSWKPWDKGSGQKSLSCSVAQIRWLTINWGRITPHCEAMAPVSNLSKNGACHSWFLEVEDTPSKMWQDAGPTRQQYALEKNSTMSCL